MVVDLAVVVVGWLPGSMSPTLLSYTRRATLTQRGLRRARANGSGAR